MRSQSRCAVMHTTWGFAEHNLGDGNIRRMAVILSQLQVAAVVLMDEKHVPMLFVEGIIHHDMEQKAQSVLSRVFSLLVNPEVRE